MSSATTDMGALVAATAGSLQRVSMLKANAGCAGARRRARVKTTAMREGIVTQPVGVNGGRVVGTDFKTPFHEFGAKLWNGGRLTAQPMLRPSMPEAQAGW